MTEVKKVFSATFQAGHYSRPTRSLRPLSSQQFVALVWDPLDIAFCIQIRVGRGPSQSRQGPKKVVCKAGGMSHPQRHCGWKTSGSFARTYATKQETFGGAEIPQANVSCLSDRWLSCSVMCLAGELVKVPRAEK